MNKKRRKQLEQIAEALERLKDDLSLLQQEEQDGFDALPDSLQLAERGQLMDDASNALLDAETSLDEAIDHIKNAIKEP